MMSKTVLGCFAAVLLLAACPVLGVAQNAGFRVGIAPAPVAFLPTQAPAVVVRSTFIGMPALVIPGPTAIPPIQMFPTFPSLFVPNHTFVPVQTVLPPPVVNPSPTLFFPANTVQPGLPIGPSVHPGPPLAGTPRAEVLRQFGQPSVTVITSTGETLFFTGGVTVIIQNGQVAGPR
jgi:hypothetical protein